MEMKHLTAFIVLLLAAVSFRLCSSDCNTCMSNGVACINQTSFSICYGPNSDIVDTQEFTCPSGQVCTSFDYICGQNSSKPACGDTSQCGVCTVNGFACTSRSTFAICLGLEITDVRGKCQDGLICDANSSQGVCVKPCKGGATCDIPIPLD